MLFGFVGWKSQKRSKVPWESIDPRDGAEATDWAEDSKGKWSLEAPSGEWEMEGAAPATPVEGSGVSAGPGVAEGADGSLTHSDVTNGPAVAGAAEVFDSAGEEVEDDNVTVPLESIPDEVGEEEAYPAREAAETGAWTISILCMGLGLIAACLVIPQADANRRLVYEREQLRLDLAQIQKQISVNKEFLAKMEVDPQLTERLAQREMHSVEEGEAVIDVKDDGNAGQNASLAAERMSPFAIVKVPPPPALAAYEPVGGSFADLCRNQQSHIYVLGIGMIMVAGGLVMGGPAKVGGTLGDLSGESSDESSGESSGGVSDGLS